MTLYQLYFSLGGDLGLHQRLVVWEHRPQRLAQPPHAEDVGEHAVPHDGLAELHPGLVVEVHEGVADGDQGVGPGQGLVLVPPPPHHVTHVEPEEEGHLLGQRTEVLVEIVNNSVELLSVLLPQPQPEDKI